MTWSKMTHCEHGWPPNISSFSGSQKDRPKAVSLSPISSLFDHAAGATLHRDYFDIIAPCGLSFLVSLPHQIGHSAAGRGAPTVDDELSAGGVGGEVGAEEEHHVGNLVHRRVAPARDRGPIASADRGRVSGRDLFLQRMNHARVDRPGAHGA